MSTRYRCDGCGATLPGPPVGVWLGVHDHYDACPRCIGRVRAVFTAPPDPGYDLVHPAWLEVRAPDGAGELAPRPPRLGLLASMGVVGLGAVLGEQVCVSLALGVWGASALDAARLAMVWLFFYFMTLVWYTASRRHV